MVKSLGSFDCLDDHLGSNFLLSSYLSYNRTARNIAATKHRDYKTLHNMKMFLFIPRAPNNVNVLRITLVT